MSQITSVTILEPIAALMLQKVHVSSPTQQSILNQQIEWKNQRKKKWFNTRVSVIHWSYDIERGSRTSTSAHHYTNKLQAKNSRGIWRNLLNDFKAVARRMQHTSYQQGACLYILPCVFFFFLIFIVSLQYSQSQWHRNFHLRIIRGSPQVSAAKYMMILPEGIQFFYYYYLM